MDDGQPNDVILCNSSVFYQDSLVDHRNNEETTQNLLQVTAKKYIFIFVQIFVFMHQFNLPNISCFASPHFQPVQ